MAKRLKQKQSGEYIPQHSANKNLPVKERVRKHLRDKNDVITDDDIKNININEYPVEEPLALSNKEARPKDEDKDPKNVTPWDLLKE